ncbi:MAG TPA: hypothetical protein VGJ87_22065 [Roseiflexaceae bacterium]|jgi:zinc transporter ZupT
MQLVGYITEISPAVVWFGGLIGGKMWRKYITETSSACFMLFIGAADILPQAHSEQSSSLTIALTCLGAAFIFAVTHIAG